MNIRILPVLGAALLLLGACGTEETGNGTAPGGLAVVCGDNVCGISELDSCPEDCGPGAAVCGNGVCSAAESSSTCPEDCGRGVDQGDFNNGGGNNGVGNNGGGNNGGGNNGVGNREYPEAGNFVDLGQVMPNVGWANAHKPDGTVVEFTMEKWLNDAEYAHYNSIAFVLGTGWCPACPQYIEHVNSLSAQLESNNMMVVYIEAEDNSYAPATSEFAYAFINDHIGEGLGLRVGDADTMPTPGAMIRSPVVQSFPSGWVVRRSDMTVIASQHASQYIIPFAQIAADPDSGDWNGEPVIEPNCGEEDEETYEGSNDDPRTAPVIEPGTSFDGGICAVGPDYYRIEIEGPWRADLEFSHGVGDLDMYLWDIEKGEVATDENNRPIGSDSITDNESFEYEGSAILLIFGYDYNTTTYTFSVNSL